MFRIEATAGDLRRALSAVAPATDLSRSSIPILSMVLFDGATVTATDLDIRIRANIPAISAKEGKVAISYRMLKSLVSKIDADEVVTIEQLDGVGASLTFSLGRYVLPTLPGSDFPVVVEEAKFAGVAAIEVDGKDWGASLDFVSHAISTEATRYYLNGIYADRSKDGVCAFIATDGHRLAYHRAGFDFGDLAGAIIPRVTVDALRAMPAPKSIRRIGLNALFDFDGVQIGTKLIDGTYPDWRRVVPAKTNDADQVLTLPTKATASAVARILSLIGARTMYSNAVSIVYEGEKVAVTRRGPERQTGAEIIPLASAQIAKAGALGYNGDYLQQVMRTFKKVEAVKLVSMGPSAPARIEAASDPEGRFLVLMPMRVDDNFDLARTVLPLATKEAA